ncbi:amidohydrolase family protein [Pseudomonas brassicacearum]
MKNIHGASAPKPSTTLRSDPRPKPKSCGSTSPKVTARSFLLTTSAGAWNAKRIPTCSVIHQVARASKRSCQLWTGAIGRGLAPSLVVQQLSHNPAKHFLLDDRKGDFALGQDADFVVLAQERYRYDPSSSLSAVTWSSFEGMEFTARVKATYCRGQSVFDQGKILNKPGYGRFLRPRPSTQSIY